MGIYDTGVGNILDELATPGTVAIDVGHHIGYFSLKLARGVGPTGEVHSFDPDPRAHERLLGHIKANATPWVHVNQCAVSDEPGRLGFFVADQLGWASTKRLLPDTTEITVTAVTLDQYLAEHAVPPERVSVIKLDVESAELEALRGMRGLLMNGSPTVVVEILPERLEQRADQIFTLMEALGYASSAPEGDVVFRKRDRALHGTAPGAAGAART
jgi:FkbM family methyltransferase